MDINKADKRITIYMDETYLDNNSGIIQSAIPVQKQTERALIDAVNKLKKDHERFHIKEFKANKISKGNRRIYEKFLQYVINFSGETSDKSILRPIVTIESTLRHGDIASLLSQVINALSKLGVTNEEHLAEEFTKQIWWISRFFCKICPKQISSEFEFVFDNKHRYAQKCLAYHSVRHPNGYYVLWEGWKTLTTFAGTLLANAKNMSWHPSVTQFSYHFSQHSYFLQACDILSNLFYNAMKYDLGISEDLVAMKYDMMRAVIPGFKVDGTFRKDFQTTGDKLICTNANWSGHFQLSPLAR